MDPFSVAGISAGSYTSLAQTRPRGVDGAALARLDSGSSPGESSSARSDLQSVNLHQQMGTQLMSMLMGLMGNQREG